MSKSNESKLYNLIKSIIKDKAFTVRVETGLTMLGVPDLYIVYNGVAFWLELKCNTLKNCNLSKYQVNWLLQHKRHGGLSFILNRPHKQGDLKLLEINPSGVASEVLNVKPDAVGIEAILVWVVKRAGLLNNY
jgi:hypothetical protein